MQENNNEAQLIQQYVNCSYQDLQNFNCQVNLQEVVQTVGQGLKMDWKKQIESFYYLRVLLKFNQGQINSMFQVFGEQIIRIMEKKQPTHLKKIVLVFMKEVFMKSGDEQINGSIINYIVPFIVPRLQQNEKPILKYEAQQNMEQLINNCWDRHELYEVICKLTADKNHLVSEQAIKLLAQLIQYVGIRIKTLQIGTLKLLMCRLQVLVSSKRQNEQSYGCQILEYIHGLVGNQGFNNMVTELLDQQQQNILVASVSQLSNKKNVQQNYKLIKQQDKENIKQIKRQSMANIIQAKKFNVKVVNDPNFIDLNVQQNQFY